MSVNSDKCEMNFSIHNNVKFNYEDESEQTAKKLLWYYSSKKQIIYDTMDKFVVKTADNSTRIKPLGTNKCRQVVW